VSGSNKRNIVINVDSMWSLVKVTKLHMLKVVIWTNFVFTEAKKYTVHLPVL
jgi:hypothetical protein